MTADVEDFSHCCYFHFLLCRRVISLFSLLEGENIEKKDVNGVLFGSASARTVRRRKHVRSSLALKLCGLAAGFLDFSIVLKLALFVAEVAIVIPSSIIAGGCMYGVGGAVLFTCLSQIPMFYLVWKMIKREDDQTRVMTEAWEIKKETKEAVADYLKLLREQNHQP